MPQLHILEVPYLKAKLMNTMVNYVTVTIKMEDKSSSPYGLENIYQSESMHGGIRNRTPFDCR